MVREPYQMRLSTSIAYRKVAWPRCALILLILFGISGLLATPAHSQNPEQVKVVPAGEGGRPAVGPDGKPIDPNAKPADPNAKPADPNAKPADPGIKVIRRTEYLKTPSTSEKFKAAIGADGKVEFHFEGTPWPPVLDWLAEISGKSLDWQELPGDVLNLHTQRRYTPEEARDLLNWHLLARGFTLLLHDEVFTVANVKGINPGIVPRVTEEELATRMPSEFVKISLPLEWIIAEDAATQLAPMLSPNGKLSAIKSVNRIEAIDAVSNLRDIVTLLRDEQTSRRNDRALVRVFKLQHVRADEVIVSLMSILGIEKRQPLGGSGGNSNGMMQMMQMQMQMQQQMMQQQQANAQGAQKPLEPKLVLNSRENSILATAPPDKMEIIEQTVKALDISPDSEDQLLRNLDRMRVYRLTTLKPEPLAEILTDVGNLSPGARIRIDKENNSIVLFGSLSDHVTVQALVQKLDGSGRTFAVIPLRRLQAEEVAGSIQFMMGPEKKEETQRSRWSYYDYFGGNQDTTRKDERPFRVDADIENNRLLVWANEIEMKEVQGLLEKLGEIPGNQSNPNTSRTIEFASPEEAARTLQQLKQLWPHMAPNKLLSPGDEPAAPAESAPAPQKKPAAPRDTQNRDAAIHRPPQVRLAQLETVQVEKDAEPSTDASAPRHPLADDEETTAVPSEVSPTAVPPIAVQQLPDGRVIIGSDDTAALDQLELLVQEIRPKTENFQIFHLKNANTWAYGIEMNLKDFFETEENDKTFLDWYGDVVTTKDKTPNRLSKRRKLKIISDSDSHTILVQNATAEQLATIERLISIYDRPETNDPRAVRLTRTFGLKFSQASVIAETVKSVYRDLLSSNDPSLQNKGDGKQQPQAGPSTSYVFGRSSNNDDKKDEPKDQPIRFKGLLSIGVDEISNTIVVSAASGLMEDISHLIESLDEAAKPTTTFQVVPLSQNVDPVALQEKLGRMIEAGRRSKIKVSSSGERSAGPGQNPGAPQQAAPSAAAPPGQ